jgi:hypothetical protein
VEIGFRVLDCASDELRDQSAARSRGAVDPLGPAGALGLGRCLTPLW